MPKARMRARTHGTLPTEEPLIYLGLVAETTDPLDLPYTPTFEDLNELVGFVGDGSCGVEVPGPLGQ